MVWRVTTNAEPAIFAKVSTPRVTNNPVANARRHIHSPARQRDRVIMVLARVVEDASRPGWPFKAVRVDVARHRAVREHLPCTYILESTCLAISHAVRRKRSAVNAQL